MSKKTTINLFSQGTGTVSIATPRAGNKRPPAGVPVIKSWKELPNGGISGLIYGSSSFADGEFIETSPIANGVIGNGSVVATKSKSRYFLSPETVEKKSNIFGAFKVMLSAQPGATITLTREMKDKSTKAAIQAVEKKAETRSTFSLFGIGMSEDDSPYQVSQPYSKGTRTVKKYEIAIKNKIIKTTASAPKGVPTLTNWKQNRNGSITGFITGSPKFKEGERVTTSPITNGRYDQYSVVTTGSGSRYFLG